MAKIDKDIRRKEKYTKADFETEFPNDAACLDDIKEQRWPAGITVCDSKECDNVERRHHRVSGRTAYACDYCGKHIYPLAGTIFEKSTTSLKTWFYAMFLMGSTRCGISAKQIERETGVTYKTAWRMFKQIRTLMSEHIKLEGSSVEMDESYFGPKRKHGEKRGRPSASSDRQCVVGIVERKGRVVAMTAENATKQKLMSIATERILPQSTMFTDEWAGSTIWAKLATSTSGTSIAKFMSLCDIHTQTIDGFWALVKLGIRGVYHSVGRGYFKTYLNKYSFRYNRRGLGYPTFISLLEKIAEKAS